MVVLNDFQILLVYIPLAAIMIYFIVETFNNRKSPLFIDTIFLVASLLGWLLSIIAYHIVKDAAMARVLYDIKLPFVALSTCSVLLYVIRFYGIQGYHSSAIVSVILVIPAVTAVLSFTSVHHEYIRVGFRVVETWPTHLVEGTRGIWFWIHTSYSYVLTFVALSIGVAQYRKIPTIYRASSHFLYIGMVVPIALNIVFLAGVFETSLDVALIGASICTIFLYFSTRRHQGIQFINDARIDAFNELSEAVFVFDRDNKVFTYNKAGEILEKKLGVSIRDECFRQKLDESLMNAADKLEMEEGESKSIIYYFNTDSEDDTVMNVREKELCDKRNVVIATLCIYMDVTESHSILKKLEMDAGVDALTGLLNRRMIDKVKAEFESDSKYLPVCVISGDLNNLKVVNDTMGHEQGDLVFRETSDVLISSCPPNANIARIGGDEFLIIIPNFSQSQADTLVNEIEENMRRAVFVRFGASMALGVCVKENEGQRLADIIELADSRMYTRKAEYKRLNPNIAGRK